VLMVLLAPRGRHLLALGVAAGALAISVGGGLAIEAWNPQMKAAAPGATPITALTATDSSPEFSGGRVVTGDAAEGRAARLLQSREPLALGVDVQPGQTYTVRFAVKPLRPEVTDGYVGNSTGLSWGQAYWTAAPVTKWQFFEKTLKATVATDQLALSAVYGSPRVLFDAIRVSKGKQPGWSGDYLATPVRIRKGFVANDAVAPLFGGRSVVGGAARGHLSRLLERGDQLGIKIAGLRPGGTYTVRFAVKPLAAMASAGFVGDPHGLGWGLRHWRTAPRAEWQRIHATLRATSRSEELVIAPRSGAPKIEVDAVELLPGGHLPPNAAPPPKSTWHEEGTRHSPPRPTPPGPGALPLASDFKNTFAGDTISGQNASWRLAIWRYMARQTLKEPVFGVGFGKPANFVWNGVRYDARVGDTSNTFDVVAPHNSFVNLLYRTGLVGFLGLLAILAVAAIRVWRALHASAASQFNRAVLLGCVGAFVFSAVTASFSVALEAPFLALIFWLYLALLLVLPGMLGSPQAGQRSSEPAV
jgi:O-Antigen ligase